MTSRRVDLQLLKVATAVRTKLFSGARRPRILRRHVLPGPRGLVSRVRILRHVPATFFTHDSTLPHSICVRITSDLEHLSFSHFVLFFLALLAKSSLFSLFVDLSL